MSVPTTDRGGIQQAIRTLKANGWMVAYVWDGGDMVPVSTETEAIDAIMAVDDATLKVVKDGVMGHILFVLGNSPEEVICDYTLTPGMSDILDELLDSWA